MRAYKYFLIALVVILIDQTSKLLIHKYMYIHQEVNVVGEWFRLHYLLNPGMAFGIRWQSEFGKLALTVFRIGAMIGIAYYLWKMAQKHAHNGFLICMALILGGAIGNVIDSTFYGVFLNNAPLDSPTKWFHGQVIDMLYFPLFHFYLPEWMPWKAGEYFEFFSPVFNIADSSIFIGVVSILIFQHRFFTERELPVETTATDSTTEVVAGEVIAGEQTDAVPQVDKEHYYRVFFGEAADYYMHVKKEFERGKSTSFNFFSFFCGPLWLICRKMYGLSVVFVIVQFLVALFAPGFAFPIFGMLIALLLGFYGNNLYIQKAETVVEEVMNDVTTSPEAKEEILKRKGGVTYITSIVIGLLFVILFYLSL